MSTVGFDLDSARKIANAVRRVEQQILNLSHLVKATPRTAEGKPQLFFSNDSAEVIPPFALLRVTSFTAAGRQAVAVVTKPNDSDDCEYLVNNHRTVQPGRLGKAQLDHVIRLRVAGSPGDAAMLRPAEDSWNATAADSNTRPPVAKSLGADAMPSVYWVKTLTPDGLVSVNKDDAPAYLADQLEPTNPEDSPEYSDAADVPITFDTIDEDGNKKLLAFWNVSDTSGWTSGGPRVLRLVAGAAQWGTETDELVKTTATDASAGYLADKVANVYAEGAGARVAGKDLEVWFDTDDTAGLKKLHGFIDLSTYTGYTTSGLKWARIASGVLEFVDLPVDPDTDTDLYVKTTVDDTTAGYLADQFENCNAEGAPAYASGALDVSFDVVNDSGDRQLKAYINLPNFSSGSHQVVYHAPGEAPEWLTVGSCIPA